MSPTSALRTLALMLVLAATPRLSRAVEEVPFVLVHQGRLLNEFDQGAEGSHVLHVSLYGTDAGGPAAVWTEDFPIVIGTDGLYTIVLGGTGKALNPADFAGPRWLAARLDNLQTDFSPRLRIGSVASAIVAAEAAVARALACPGCVGTTHIAAGAVTNALVADGTLEVAKLKNLNGHVAGLNADLLDGFDASAFASAAIEPKVDTIAADTAALRIDTGTIKTDIGVLHTNVAGVKTDVAGVKTDVAGVKADVAAVKSAVDGVAAQVQLVKTDTGGQSAAITAVQTNLGANAGTRIDRLLARSDYSESCLDSWVAAAWGTVADATGYQGCMRDGRWHVALNVAAPATAGTLAQLTAFVDGGAQARVTVPTSYIRAFDCQRVELRDAGRLLCVGAHGSHPGDGGGAGGRFANDFHWIALMVDTSGKAWHSSHEYAATSGAPTGRGPTSDTWGGPWYLDNGSATRWWIRF